MRRLLWRGARPFALTLRFGRSNACKVVSDEAGVVECIVSFEPWVKGTEDDPDLASRADTPAAAAATIAVTMCDQGDDCKSGAMPSPRRPICDGSDDCKSTLSLPSSAASGPQPSDIGNQLPSDQKNLAESGATVDDSVFCTCYTTDVQNEDPWSVVPESTREMVLQRSKELGIETKWMRLTLEVRCGGRSARASQCSALFALTVERQGQWRGRGQGERSAFVQGPR